MTPTCIKERGSSASFGRRAAVAAVLAAAIFGGYFLWRGETQQRREYELSAGSHGLSSRPRPETLKGMALIPAGEFQMGSQEGEGQSEEHPLHKIYLDAYYIDKREVTAGQYKNFAESTGREMREQEPWSTDAHPVVRVNWYDAWAYCKWAGSRLPTEAEWEKAARGGMDADFNPEKDYVALDKYSWNGLNSGNLPHPVGLKEPNLFGLYDMRGNVWEWTADWLDYEYYRKSPAQNPQGPDSGRYRVLRGGSAHYDASYLRMAYRSSNFPGFRSDDVGFRCAASAAKPKS
jgi:formylglycine-generating enzyme required for sulfatase activity